MQVYREKKAMKMEKLRAKQTWRSDNVFPRPSADDFAAPREPDPGMVRSLFLIWTTIFLGHDNCLHFPKVCVPCSSKEGVSISIEDFEVLISWPVVVKGKWDKNMNTSVISHREIKDFVLVIAGKVIRQSLWNKVWGWWKVL